AADGETLRERLAGGSLPVVKALELAIQVAEGLAAAHEKGIVHRDLKPDNVFLTSDGRAKILDFGLAKLTRRETGILGGSDPGQTPALTQLGTVVGTAAYMSPEQARGYTVDHRSDIFAFGLLLHEMVSGRSPFLRETPVDTISALLNAEPPPLGELEPPLGTALDRIVRHCLEKLPENRFQASRDLAFALRSLTAPSGTRTVRVAPPAVRRRRWSVLLVAGAVALGVAGSALLGRYVLSPSRAPSSPVFTQRSFRAQTIFSARFGPDGRTIAYSAAQRGISPELLVIRPEYPESVPLGPAGAHLLAISSRGELAVLTRPRPLVFRLFVGTLARVSMGGGAPRELLDDVHDADWLPDGSEFAVVRDVGGRDRVELPAGTVVFASSGYLSDLRVSPDGERLAFIEHPVRYDNRGLAVIVDRQGRRVAASEPFDAMEGLAWSPDGDEIFFSAQVGAGLNSLAVHTLSLGDRCRQVLSSPGRLTIHDIARDGRWLVTRDDWRIEMVAKAPGETPERDLSWLDCGIQPLLSPDGRTLLFLDQSEAAGPSYAVYMRDTDGSPSVRLGEGSSHDLSPDGHRVLAIVRTTPPSLRIYPLGAGDARSVELPGLAELASARWMPDGKALLLCGNEPGSASRCFVRAADGGPQRPVTPEGVNDGWPSPDGTTLVAMQVGRGYLLFPLAGGEPRPLSGLTADDAIARWSPDGHSIWVWRRPGLVILVDRYDLATGQRQRIAEINPRSSIGVLGVRLTLADNPAVYAYQTWQTLSHLFLVEGVR
ncbi:MAG TPA: protein kinase, partial [Thermoanaerobaculaceae bacterium]|nr:protein kinase [Thermoanaerobaculaceae bacterium]